MTDLKETFIQVIITNNYLWMCAEKDFCFWASGRKSLSKDLYEKWDKRHWIVRDVRNQGEIGKMATGEVK